MNIEDSALPHIVSALRDHGIEEGVINKTLKACLRDVSSSDQVTQETEAKFIAEATILAGDATFAARVGFSFHLESTLSDYIARYSKDLRSALDQSSRFHAVDSPALGWSLKQPGNAASLDLFWKEGKFKQYWQYAEFCIFSTLARLRMLTQTELCPIEIRFIHDAKTLEKPLTELAGCPVRFGSESFEILLPLSSLGLSIPSYDPRLHALLSDFGERLLRDHHASPETLRSKVEGQIMSALPTKLPKADEVAVNLGMSRRTFDRRLKDQDLTYREIVDELRYGLAKSLLQNALVISDVAFALGYADQAAFSTAFKRWSGDSPSRFHESLNGHHS